MKFLFSLLFLISSIGHAKIVNIYYQAHHDLASQLKDQVAKRQFVPIHYISLIQGDCNSLVNKKFWNICINEKKELIELPSNYRFVTKSISTFKIP
jgi:hypothetical protein